MYRESLCDSNLVLLVMKFSGGKRKTQKERYACVKAPPVDGAANKALVQLLAKTLSIRKSNITLVSGATVRNKIIEVEGLTVDELRNRLIRP